MQQAIGVRFRFRSESMIPLLTIMQRARLWEEEGVDVRDFAFTDDPLGAEDMLVAQEIDFIFGNHVSPYYRLTKGYPLVCLAQTENWEHIWVATRPEITSLSMLQGKRVIGRPLLSENGEFAGHAHGSRLLALELNGVDTGQLEYVKPDSVGNPVQAVHSGQADACFIDPERADSVESAGLRVHRLPKMGMIHSITFTTTMPHILKRPELAERVIRVMARAVHFFKTRREDTLELLKHPIMPMPEGRYERIANNYEHYAANYEAGLYPHPEAILNVYRLSCMVYEESKRVNPMELWNVQPLRLVHMSGFFNSLYRQRPAGPEMSTA